LKIVVDDFLTMRCQLGSKSALLLQSPFVREPISDHLLSPFQGIFHRFAGYVQSFRKFVHVPRIFDVVAHDSRSYDLPRTDSFYFVGSLFAECG